MSTFTRRRRINGWDHDPEYREGDFFGYKDVHQGVGTVDDYAGSPALLNLITSYSYWIAFADLDGFRIDTVKHMDPGAIRLICSAIKEFATMIGKDSFFLVGEITGGREFAFKLMQTTGLDAALGIGDVQDKLEYAARGGPTRRSISRCFATQNWSARAATRGSVSTWSPPTTITIKSGKVTTSPGSLPRPRARRWPPPPSR